MSTPELVQNGSSPAQPSQEDQVQHLFVTVYARPRSVDARSLPPTNKRIALTSTQSELSNSLRLRLQNLFSHPIDNATVTAYAYTPDIFQIFFPFPPSGSPAPPTLSDLRHHPLSQNAETNYSVEILYDIFTLTSSSPSPSSTCMTPTRPIRLALFDMDSTLIQQEIIDVLASSLGPKVVSAVSSITERAMNGELDFAASLRERVAMLKGVPADVWDTLKTGGQVTLSPGVKDLIACLQRQQGHRVITGVISGGFIEMAEWVKQQLGLDLAFANHLETSPSTPSNPYAHLTGHLSPAHPIITPDFKRETLLRLVAEYNIPISQTLAVGDGSNDVPMLCAAGVGIAWNAKAVVQEKAPLRLNGVSLREVGFILGPEE